LQFERVFLARAPADGVYGAMLDLPSAARCLPGTTVADRGEDGRHPATIAVKAGPLRLGYEGTVAVSARDSSARTATMLAEGRERRGLGAASATIVLAVEPDGDARSCVTIVIDLAVTGRVAQLGHGILQPLAASMVGRFGSCLERRLVDGGGAVQLPADAAEPAAVSLLLRSMWTRIRHPHHHHEA
jgi:carbon monoxide dehydrogenase subunit G